MDAVTAFIASAMATPWIYLAIVLAVIVDAFFPPVPAETIVVAAVVAGVAFGHPVLPLVIVCAAVGAIVGDNLTFAIGRSVGIDRFRWMRGRRMRAAIDTARRGLDRRPAVILMTARHVPVGRAAVNLVAGASGFRRRTFFLLSLVTGVFWAVYSTAIGLLAGHLMHGNALLGMLVGVVGGLLTGVVVDLVLRLVRRWRARRTAPGATRIAPADQGIEAECIGAE